MATRVTTNAFDLFLRLVACFGALALEAASAASAETGSWLNGGTSGFGIGAGGATTPAGSATSLDSINGDCLTGEGEGGIGAGFDKRVNCSLAMRLFGLSTNTRRKQYSRRSRSGRQYPRPSQPCSDAGSIFMTCANNSAACGRLPAFAAAIPALRISSFDKMPLSRFARIWIF